MRPPLPAATRLDLVGELERPLGRGGRLRPGDVARGVGERRAALARERLGEQLERLAPVGGIRAARPPAARRRGRTEPASAALGRLTAPAREQRASSRAEQPTAPAPEQRRRRRSTRRRARRGSIAVARRRERRVAHAERRRGGPQVGASAAGRRRRRGGQAAVSFERLPPEPALHRDRPAEAARVDRPRPRQAAVGVALDRVGVDDLSSSGPACVLDAPAGAGATYGREARADTLSAEASTASGRGRR